VPTYNSVLLAGSLVTCWTCVVADAIK